MKYISKVGIAVLLVVGSSMRASSEPKPELVGCQMWQNPPSCLEDCTKVNGSCSHGDKNQKCVTQAGECGLPDPQPSVLGAYIPASCDADGDGCYCIW